MMPTDPEIQSPPYREALRFWIKLGFISFGGPAGQIAILHRELVERKRWISERDFMHALNFCMLLPGPEAQQLATYLGWRLHGAKGGVTAGVLFVLPSVFILLCLSWLYMAGGHLPWLAALFHGLTAAVIAVVTEAVLRIGGKALQSPALWFIALASFAAIYFGKISFIWIIFASASLAWVGHGLSPRQFPAGKRKEASGTDSASSIELAPVHAPGWKRNVTVILLCLTLWWSPILVLAQCLGQESILVQEGLFFSKVALVTFGGAYAVLPYVAEQAVEIQGWLSNTQMMGGLALAETTPGPLIMVLQFVGFVGAWQNPGTMSPLLAGTLGALITTWVTFVPSFLFVFLGAPYIGRLGELPRLSASLSGITAAVVGVIFNLGIKFAEHALWPEMSTGSKGTFDWFVAVLAVCAFLALQRFKIALIPVIAGCGLCGILFRFLIPAL